MKIGLVSLGCPKNLVDSEVMLGLARDSGHLITRNAEDADVLVVNTCAFIDAAKQESVDTILEMAELKKTGRCQSLIVTGCMAERYRDELRTLIPDIDGILGTGEVGAFVNAIEGRAPSPPAPAGFIQVLRSNGEPVESPRAAPDTGLPTYLYDADTPRYRTTPPHYAYLKIGEGCDYSCAFCIIPTLRGKYRSRTPESVLAEATRLAGQGVRELILVSQDTSFYGNDQGERGALPRLLRALGAVPALEWIRMLYLYPTTITDALLEAIVETPIACRYIDLPLQHASDSVLRRMKRPGTQAGYARLLDRIRTTIPGVTLRTTFIVGFPGETEADVESLARFIESQRFDHLGVFTYSHEEGTTAHDFIDDVPADVKQQRQAQLMTIQRDLVANRLRERIGQRVRVLVDGPSGEHEWVVRGRLEGQAPDIDSVVYLSECDPGRMPAGTFIDTEIVDSSGYDLVARPLGGQAP